MADVEKGAWVQDFAFGTRVYVARDDFHRLKKQLIPVVSVDVES